MHIIQSNAFERDIKKLHPNQKREVDNTIRIIANNPLIGRQKIGNLTGMRVYKFKMIKQQTLIAYLFEKNRITLTFLAVGPHENFYRDLK